MTLAEVIWLCLGFFLLSNWREWRGMLFLSTPIVAAIAGAIAALAVLK
jgi:hypothetical protein